MAVFKCKMCGGTIEFEQGATVGTCDSCCTKQTLPRLDDDRRVNLYDRANHFRRNNDFDKAMSIYEQILNEDNSDAEAYWSIVLCRYGIEYVEDPSSHKRVPTVNRAQYTSIFADEDYKSALQYADLYQKSIYEDEAKAIDEIQKGILAISQKEEPFDVFICYKETDANGRRTQDSVLANDLYHQLTQEGFKVFFSRITLEDKLGTAYEPYIFAALNSAKVMVVLGTKPEYFNAVWVKNEWSRYLALIKTDGKKILIPAYRDMDPYDLPEEFSHLQAQDMSKLGFMQDLIRGIKKILSADEAKTTVKETVVVNQGTTTIAPLLERVYLFLEDGSWQDADAYCEKVLDIDPKNVEAYLGKLMAELQICKKEEIKNSMKPLDSSKNYQRVLRFADPELTKKLEGDSVCISKNIQCGKMYDASTKMMSIAKDADVYRKVAKGFQLISGYKDSDILAQQCLERAEECRKNAVYDSAKLCMRNAGNKISDYESAIRGFQAIPGWKDSDESALECQKRIDEIKEKREKDRIEAERKAEEHRIASAKRKKKIKKIIAITAIILCICVVCVVSGIVLVKVIIPNYKYSKAVSLMNDGEYEEAITAFENLDDYKDSKDQIEACWNAIDYNATVDLMNEGKIVEAYESLIALDGYRDSDEKAREIFEQYMKEKCQVAEVGDTIYFGSYEQDNNSSNGKEDIEWIILDKKKDRILVISKYALDCQKFNSTITKVTWETCSLRAWMNGAFFDTAFSAEEQTRIAVSEVIADANPEYSTKPGNTTSDKVFLLSINEVNKYFSSDWKRQCVPTAYAIDQGTHISTVYSKGGENTCNWWLRSPGTSQYYAANVDYGGSVGGRCHEVDYALAAVRPAMWIDFESE